MTAFRIPENPRHWATASSTTTYLLSIPQYPAVIQQYIPSVNCGTVDPATNLADFQSALKAAGIDTVIEENQKQLDDWAASQAAE